MFKVLCPAIAALLFAAQGFAAQDSVVIHQLPDRYMTAAMGTGVGNGGENLRATRENRIERELGAVHTSRVDDLYRWCGGVVRVLDREVHRANNLVNKGDFAGATQVLEDAYVAISKSLTIKPYASSPLTKKLVDRGLRYLHALRAANGKHPTGADLQTEGLFMMGFTQYIMQVERELDRPYYIPYTYEHHRCHGDCGPTFNYKRFVALYLKVAKQELRFVLNTFISRVHIREDVSYRPIGNVNTYLKLAELSSKAVALDISDTLYRYEYSCTVESLLGLAENLRDFNNSGDRSIYGSQYEAVQDSARTLYRLVNHMECEASGGEWADESDTPVESRELLGSSFTVYPGQVQTVRVRPGYIHKLYISATSYYGGTVEVIVNGDTKGTVRVPAYDPNYVVTIEDQTRSIEFRNTSRGSVQINSIYAVRDSRD